MVAHLEDSGLPELGRQVPVGLRKREIDSLDEVTQGTRVATRRSVAVLNAGLTGKEHRGTHITIYSLFLQPFSRTQAYIVKEAIPS